MAEKKDRLVVANATLASRMMLGSAHYPSPAVLGDCVKAAKPGFVTVSVRRAGSEGKAFYKLLTGLGVPIVPNTSGCRTAKEACLVASMARELLGTDWVKLEVIGDDDTLAPDPSGLVEAAEKLANDNFQVLAYCTEDIEIIKHLALAGCAAIMPWGSPIGSGQGIINARQLTRLRDALPDKVLIVDAGIGRPSDAAIAMELGFDGVLLNTAVARAGNPVSMARAFADAIKAGRTAHLSGIMPKNPMATPSSPAPDTAADLF